MSSADKLARMKVNTGGPKPELGKITPLRRRKKRQKSGGSELVKKGIQLSPEMVKEFEILRAGQGRKGYVLWAEAVNLLLKSYGRDPVEVDFLKED